MATMRFEEALQAAKKQFDADSNECIRLAKRNLTDRSLPLYYEIQNCILVASACDLWEDADVWRNAARQAYYTSHAKASREKDTAALEACKDLDGLDKLLAEEMDEFLEEERVDLPHTPESEKIRILWGSEASEVGSCVGSDVGSDEGDRENEILKVGDEQGEASGTLDLPLRGRTVPPPEPNAAAPTPKSTTASQGTSTPKSWCYCTH